MPAQLAPITAKKMNKNKKPITPGLRVLSLEEAIAAGKVKVNSHASLTVPGKFLNGGRDQTENYKRLDALDLEGALAMCKGDEARVLEIFNRQYDSIVRIRVRQMLIRKAAKPEKAVLQAAGKLVRAGIVKTEKEAVTRLLNEFMPKDKNVDKGEKP